MIKSSEQDMSQQQHITTLRKTAESEQSKRSGMEYNHTVEKDLKKILTGEDQMNLIGLYH